jgi:glycosyltransferase A (GT-A) superfamily protein (DUF2064 family)
VLAKTESTKKPAVAVFVKTPGRSPVKTRLGKGIGPKRAEEFFDLALAVCRAWMREVSPIATCYWAVAEHDVDACWSDFPAILQGDGELGSRLDFVYSELMRHHPQVMLVGADCPVMGANEIYAAIEGLKEYSYVVGPAVDGGFYLFGGARPFSRWTEVPYSISATTPALLRALSEPAKLLNPLADVDTKTELKDLYEYWQKHPPALAETRAMQSWLSSIDSLLAE